MKMALRSESEICKQIVNNMTRCGPGDLRNIYDTVRESLRIKKEALFQI